MPLAPPDLRWHEEVDIGIIGAGGCGLVAAHAAVREDPTAELRVVIWEKAAAPGGSTALSSGMIAAAGTRLQREAGVVDTGADLQRDIDARNGGRSDPLLTATLCEGAAALVEWLVDACGVRLVLMAPGRDPGHRQRRLHAPPSGSGRELITTLVQSLGRRGIRVCLSTPVQQLWTDAAGAVIGARIKMPRKSATNVRCHKLICATDGFGGNDALRAQHCSDAADLAYIGAPSNTGDALLWAADVGAATRDLSAYEAYAAVAVGSQLPIPWETVTHGAVIVNQRGERFADETFGPWVLVQPVRAQPGRIAYAILDARILKAVSDQDPHFATEIVPRVARRAEDIDSLARQFQIDATSLAETITAYNELSSGAKDPFGRTRFGAPFASPFYGIRIGAAVVQTLGGWVIDPSARVLRADGTSIANLYAGGGAAVGLSGPGGDGYLLGTGLLSALGWGKIAGTQAAQELRAARPGAESVGDQ